MAMSIDNSGIFGGLMLARAPFSGLIGGYVISSYEDTTNTMCEAGARLLIKANSDEAFRQAFNIDAEFTFYGANQPEFDAELYVNRRTFDSFDSSLVVTKSRLNPHVIITSYPSGNYNTPFTFTLTASGMAYDKNRNPINSGIHKVVFIWQDGDFTIVSNPVASGYVWNASHTYTSSGIYKPIVIVRDRSGKFGASHTTVNVASGLVDFPFISLSGSPRTGFTPPFVNVSFNAAVSGTLGTYTVYWGFGNGLGYYNNDLDQTAQYAMPGDYIPWIRIRDERNINIVDTLRLGFNN